MTDANDFYLALLSNSSFQTYPENKTTAFTVDLPQNISLSGEWKVGVAEIHMQNTLHNVSEGHNVVTLKTDLEGGFTFQIPQGSYSSLSEIVDAVNFAYEELRQPAWPHLIVSFDQKTKCVSADHNINTVRKAILVFHGRLAMQFGHEYNGDVIKGAPLHEPNLFFGYPPEFLFYCDLIEPQLYGDKHAQIIKTIPSFRPNTRHGEVVMWNFNPLNYVKLYKKEFKTVTIDIRTASNEAPAFSFGTTFLLLHFIKTA